MAVTVDVVIVCYRSKDLIGPCLDAVGRLPRLGTVVVVDHSDDGSADIAAERGVTVVRDLSNPGFGAGQNAGVAATRAEFVLLLNPDAVVDAAAVGRGLDHISTHADVAAVQGAILDARTSRPQRSQGVELGPLHLWGRALGMRGLLASTFGRRSAQLVPRLRDHVDRIPAGPTEVESLAATAVIVRKAAFGAIGGFDEDYFLYGEDLDLCRRLRAAAWKLVAIPDVWATHLDGSSSETSWEREVDWWQGTLRFAATWWSHMAWISAVGAAVVRATSLSVMHPQARRVICRALLWSPFTARSERRQRR